ncbi:MAG: hypothetical protein ACI8XU_000514 [Kiritimatiellia bacterium]|jgi:hypothetical protein
MKMQGGFHTHTGVTKEGKNRCPIIKVKVAKYWESDLSGIFSCVGLSDGGQLFFTYSSRVN